jgi:protein TorT
MYWPTLLYFSCAAAVAGDWYPASTVQDGRPAPYSPLAHAVKPWRVCALLPHGRDKYWWGVAWGLHSEAQRMGVKLGIYQAGGYEFRDVQLKQFADCLAMKADAIILAAIAADGFDDAIAAAVAQGVPVIDLVNGVGNEQVSARSLVSFADMAAAAAKYLQAHARTRPVQVAWFPGPKGANWVIDAERGVERTFKGTPIKVTHGGYGAPESNRQMSLVRPLLQTSAPDYILGNAVAVEVAASYIQYRKTPTRLIAFYASEPVVELIREGRVLAAASDAPVLQARIAVDLAVRALEHAPMPRRVGPAIEILDAELLKTYDVSKLFALPSMPFIQMPMPPK